MKECSKPSFDDCVMTKFIVNQRVRIKSENPGANRRVPQYARGKVGIIVVAHGTLSNCTHDHADDWGPLYSVALDQGSSDGFHEKKIIVDVHEPWLESVL